MPQVIEEFYVYVYLDPRKPGEYGYDDIDMSFRYEPFYVGKGSGNRLNYHLAESKAENSSDPNVEKLDLIREILNEGFEPIIEIVRYFDDNFVALEYEELLEKAIGRKNIDEGPLLNMIPGGRKNLAMLGKKHSEKTKKFLSEQKRGKKHHNWGKTSGMLGKKQSKETRSKISKNCKGLNTGAKNGCYYEVDEDKVIELFHEGVLYQDIQKEMDIGGKKLRNILKKHGLRRHKAWTWKNPKIVKPVSEETKKRIKQRMEEVQTKRNKNGSN